MFKTFFLSAVIMVVIIMCDIAHYPYVFNQLNYLVLYLYSE